MSQFHGGREKMDPGAQSSGRGPKQNGLMGAERDLVKGAGMGSLFFLVLPQRSDLGNPGDSNPPPKQIAEHEARF